MNNDIYHNEITEMLLPKLSQLIENKFSSITTNNKIDFTLITKNISSQIRTILENIYIEKKRKLPLNNGMLIELFKIYTSFTYFDYFIVHKNNFEYLLTFLNYIQLTQQHNKLLSNNENVLIKYSFDLLCNLSFCDIQTANVISSNQINPIFRNNSISLLKSEYVYVYKNVYNQITSLLNLMNEKTISTENYNALIKSISQTFDTIRKDDTELFKITKEIIKLLNQNENSVLVSTNKDNIHLIICNHLYYRFGKEDIFKHINNDLTQCTSQNINLFEIELIKYCENGQQLLTLLNKKAKMFPYLLRYHMYDILFNIDGYEDINDNNILQNEVVLLLNNLSISENILFQYFANYFFDYVDNTNTTLKILHNFASKCVKKIFNTNNGEFILNTVVKEVENIKSCLKKYENTSVAINTVNKIAFWKYLEKHEYIEAIKIYNEIYNYSQNIIRNQTNHLFEDSIIIDNNCEIDLLIYILFHDTNNNDEFYVKLDYQLKKFDSFPPKISFIVKYCKFLLMKEDNIDLIQDFFKYCFIDKNCPIEMWIHVLKTFINKNITSECFNKDDVCDVLNNLLLYEDILKEKQNEYGKIYNLDNERTNIINQIKDFLFELKHQ
jgi:hypothetical protein